MDPIAEPEAPGGDPALPVPASSGRREFLGDALKLAGGALVFFAGTVASGEEHAAPEHPAEGYDWTAHRWAYLVDTERCIGCGSCVRACRAENGVPDGFVRTWVERYVVAPEGSHVDSPKGGID